MCVREEARYTIVLAFTTLPYLLYCTVLLLYLTIGHRLCSFLVTRRQGAVRLCR